jgi:recombination protein RecR
VNPIDRLTEAFEKFPGIGPRQARRFVQYLLHQSGSVRLNLAEDIKKLGVNTFQCKACFRFTVKSNAKSDVCSICGGAHRDKETLFVVEKDADIETVERSGYRGLYFVLGGVIPLATEEPEKYIRLKELDKRIEKDALKEVILGLSATTEGDHTRLLLQERFKDTSIKISSLGRGLSTGSELEYADPDTIAQALGNRH